MIVGDRVRTPEGWTGVVKKFEQPTPRGRNRRVCWVTNEHGESHAFRETELAAAPSESVTTERKP